MIRKKEIPFWLVFFLTREENNSHMPSLCILMVGTGHTCIHRWSNDKREWEYFDWPNTKHYNSITYGVITVTSWPWSTLSLQKLHVRNCIGEGTNTGRNRGTSIAWHIKFEKVAMGWICENNRLQLDMI